MKKRFKYIGGHMFALRDVEFGIHSEETCDYIATLVCDGTPIGRVSNDGHGGATSFYAFDKKTADIARQVRDDVSEVVWLTCMDGTKIYYDLGTAADEVLALMYS